VVRARMGNSSRHASSGSDVSEAVEVGEAIERFYIKPATAGLQAKI
jgi:hypothetical protein